ncbi:ATP-grasp domain-containing protein [Candidatus Bathyarchaeota archaeon]|nr:ATP-grasp domain-containing protein [Candidatus Bathyarchaeota archaeon]
MKEINVQNILVIGIDAAALATSAKMAGYNVFAVDYFGDQDLKRACKDNLSIIAQKPGKSCKRLETNFSPNALLSLTKKLLATHRINAVLLASGLEDSFQPLAKLNDLIPIIGNNPKIIKKVRDKMQFFHELKKIAIPYPETALARNPDEGKRAAKDIGYPVMVKPLAGFGGVGIRKVKDRDELGKVFPQVVSLSRGVLIQEFVSGMDASVSFLSSKKAAVVLTLNEQLLGIQGVGQKEPFGYCGNIAPASASEALMDMCKDTVQKIASHFSLTGSNGVDLVISKDGIPYVVEVNPRFQGTLECLERILEINLVNAHIEACVEGILPLISEGRPATSCVRLILYAQRRSIIPCLTDLAEARDIPLPGVIIEEGEPLCSIVVEEKTRSSALRKSMMLADLIYGIVKPQFQ